MCRIWKAVNVTERGEREGREKERERETDRQTDRQTDTDKDREREKQRQRQTDRDIERYRRRGKQRERPCTITGEGYMSCMDPQTDTTTTTNPTPSYFSYTTHWSLDLAEDTALCRELFDCCRRKRDRSTCFWDSRGPSSSNHS